MWVSNDLDEIDFHLMQYVDMLSKGSLRRKDADFHITILWVPVTLQSGFV